MTERFRVPRIRLGGASEDAWAGFVSSESLLTSTARDYRTRSRGMSKFGDALGDVAEVFAAMSADKRQREIDAAEQDLATFSTEQANEILLTPGYEPDEDDLSTAATTQRQWINDRVQRSGLTGGAADEYRNALAERSADYLRRLGTSIAARQYERDVDDATLDLDTTVNSALSNEQLQLAIDAIDGARRAGVVSPEFIDEQATRVKLADRQLRFDALYSVDDPTEALEYVRDLDNDTQLTPEETNSLQSQLLAEHDRRQRLNDQLNERAALASETLGIRNYGDDARAIDEGDTTLTVDVIERQRAAGRYGDPARPETERRANTLKASATSVDESAAAARLYGDDDPTVRPSPTSAEAGKASDYLLKQALAEGARFDEASLAATVVTNRVPPRTVAVLENGLRDSPALANSIAMYDALTASAPTATMPLSDDARLALTMGQRLVRQAGESPQSAAQAVLTAMSVDPVVREQRADRWRSQFADHWETLYPQLEDNPLLAAQIGVPGEWLGMLSPDAPLALPAEVVDRAASYAEPQYLQSGDADAAWLAALQRTFSESPPSRLNEGAIGVDGTAISDEPRFIFGGPTQDLVASTRARLRADYKDAEFELFGTGGQTAKIDPDEIELVPEWLPESSTPTRTEDGEIVYNLYHGGLPLLDIETRQPKRWTRRQ